MSMNNPSPMLTLKYTSKVNYAIQQNRIPIIRKIELLNNSEEDLSNIRIEISSDPEFVNTFNIFVEYIPKNQSIELDTKELKLSVKFLSELTEKVSGDLVVRLFQNEEVLIMASFPIEILAYDQWSGIANMPEMLAAFVTPNHPEISRIITTASDILLQWTGNPSFDAYQSLNPDRVKKQMAAIYEAIAGLGIIYCTPPASFEFEGQRIRMCDTIFSQKIATCIDITLFYASCLEAIGLNPIIVIIKGHAFVGCWLVDQTFQDSVNDDVSLLKKRTASGINEICVIESTYMNSGIYSSFDDAINAANYKLVNEDDFLLFLDIKRIRYVGIKPLPQRVKTMNGWEVVEKQEIERSFDSPVDIEIESIFVSETQNVFNKQKLWERKVLDLSLRNNLLNLRVTQNTIQLISVNLNLFEDALADGTEFQILPKPAEFVNPLNVSGVYQPMNMSDPIAELLKHELGQKRLRSYLSENDLSFALTKLFRSSRLSLEESGANTLYLALGFLRWYETSKSELSRYAPLLLLPVEIVRKSAQKGYIIRSREEETLMNITLLEMLRQDFGIVINGLEELPRDESGVDVKRIFNIVRQGIMSQSKWNVEEHAFLGTFSFNKFIMWKDIHYNAEKLKESKIVSSLISGQIEWETNEKLGEVINPDKEFSPSDIVLPISADSSQLEAIHAAVHDNSFVLHGPPGTGKSQTITNIIANAMYRGKKVLFVAEKMAALSVVQKRLADIGLEPFCLELHSNKAKKSTILEQLQKTTEVIKKSSPLEFKSEAERLNSIRNELNDYVESLHKQYPFGLSLFDCFTGWAQLNSIVTDIKFENDFVSGLTKDKLSELLEIAEDLQEAAMLCSHPFNHPLTEITVTAYSQQAKSFSNEQIGLYISLLEKLKQSRHNLLTLLNISIPICRKDIDLALLGIAKELVILSDIPDEILNSKNIENTLDNIIRLSRHGLKRDYFRDILLADFNKNILHFDAETGLSRWNIISQKWFLPRIIGQNKILKSLNQLSKNGKIEKQKVASLFEKVISFKKEQDVLVENSVVLSGALGFLWNNGNSNWEKVIRICESVIQIHQFALKVTGDTLKAAEIRENLSKFFSGGSRAFVEINGRIFQNFIETIERLKETEIRLADLLGIHFSSNEDALIDWVDSWRQKALNCKNNIDDLRDWASWNLAAEKALNAGLEPLVSALRAGHLKSEETLAFFRKGLYRQCSDYIISHDPQLSTFNGKLFENKIRKFKEKNKYFEELTKAELYAKLASSIPSFTLEAAQSSEIGILQRAIRSKGRGMSVRKLFDLIPNLLPRMCPCMLMSPISVAQYFEVNNSKFDLIVFDEASQMPTCEAIGAIGRGKNVVIVGDPKQMPPTSFFSTNNFDDDNAEKEDLESILDDCLALSIPSKYLLWHYRSKHESLIAFSNSNYYGNRLMTFPSPDDIATKVSNINVPGFYDRGKTRQNLFEAKAIVKEIIHMLSDPLLSQRSIGIVTFSSAQQNLIDDLLNEAFRLQPELETITANSNEPIFIKNLENVQGDERDVILFSMGYGPDKDGRVSLNFGPLNREGGWRRLNVAVSRARYEMKVYSTLRSEQIDITRTVSEGVAGIKAFLEYSEKGKIALSQKNYIRKEKANSFEKHVADEIRELGYTVHTDIGCSGYRIDIGIVNIENPSEYLIGILTDGENYKSAKTAKDREVIQMEVLQMLGWNIYKLWTTDWWDNPQKILQDIIDKIKEIQEIKKKKFFLTKPEAIATTATETKSDQDSAVKLQSITQHVILPSINYLTYRVCTLSTDCLSMSDKFFNPNFLGKIENQILFIVQTEGPISHALLSKRILNAWGINRLGVRLNEFLTQIYEKLLLKKTKQKDTYFYWHSVQDPSDYNVFRIPRNDEEKRNAEDLPKEEIAAGIIETLHNQISLTKVDLVKEVARLFGYARIGGNVEQAINIGIEWALKNGMIEVNNDRFVLS